MPSLRALRNTMLAAFASPLVVLIACSGYGESENESKTPTSTDSGLEDSASPDDARTHADAADASVAPCDLSKPFRAPVPVGGVNTSENELNLWLSEDEKTAYLTAIRAAVAPRYDVYTASRPTTASDFGAFVAMNDVNVADANTTDPTVTGDGLTIVFASTRPATSDAGTDLFTATRASATTAFGAALPLTNVSSGTDDQNPFLTADGLELFWNVSTAGTFEIMHAVRGVGGSFGAPETAGLGTGTSNPVLSRDALVIYYAVGNGSDIEIWTARRTARGAPFTGAMRVVELSSPERDVPQWLSPDGCRLYLMSNRGGGAGGYDQYVADRDP